MADFRIRKLTDVQMEWSNLRVTQEIKIEKIDLYQRENMKIGEIVSSAENRILEPNFGFIY